MLRPRFQALVSFASFVAFVVAPVCAAAIALPSACRFYAVGLPCDVDAQCAAEQACVDEVCVARGADGEGEGEGGEGEAAAEGEGEGEGEGADERDERTCSELKANDSSAPTGLYRLAGVLAFCEMDTDGGGWTLVARSAAAADRTAQPFGWREATGAVDDVAQPYSLGRAIGEDVLHADELLVASLDAASGLASLGPDRFIVRLEDDARVADQQVQRVGAVRVLERSCTVQSDVGEPFMLSTAGCSDFDDVFAFRDNAPCEPFFGLFADGWSLNGTPPDDESDCASSGNLDGKQGLLFVRERRSCRNIRARDPGAPTGPTVVDGAKGEVSVWCDMDVEGGGWTLLARSVEGSDVPFGWGVDEGALGDTSTAYSLDAIDAAVPAREMLIAEATGTMAPGPRQFLVEYSLQLNSPQFGDTDQQSDSAQSVGTACVGEALVAQFMMQRAGCIATTSHFYLRDNDQGICQNTGLFSGGFNLADICCDITACQRNGELLDRQGMIFSR